MTTTSRGPSRRTLVKGAAWSVPVVMVVQPAMAACASNPDDCEPPPPTVAWGTACGSTGNQNGCSGQKKALQVPMTITNDSGGPLLFVVKRGWSANGGTPPANPPAETGGAGSGNGFYGIIPGTTASCTPLTPPAACSTLDIASDTSKVLVADGQTLNLWYAFNGTGDNASSFVGKVWYGWYDPATCQEVGDGGSNQTATAIEPANC